MTPGATQAWSPEGFDTLSHGRLYEDFAVGEIIAHHWGRTLTDADIVTFATATCAWNPLYLNVEFARAHGHVSLVVPPTLLLAVVVGLSVEDLSEIGGPFLGLRRCVFARSVHSGETVTAESEVTAMRISESRPTQGVVTWRTRGFVDGEGVITFERSNLIRRRAEPVP